MPKEFGLKILFKSIFFFPFLKIAETETLSPEKSAVKITELAKLDV